MPAHESTSDVALNQIASVVSPLIGAIGTAVAGYLTLMPRFKRFARRKSEGATVEASLRALYYFPQWLNSLLCMAVVFLMIAALVGALDAQHLLPYRLDISNSRVAVIVALAHDARSAWTLIVIAIVVNVAISVDVIGRLFVTTARIVSLLPIPGLRGRFGPDGDSTGWHQANELLHNQADAQLLWIDPDGIERVAADVVEKMVTELDRVGANRAPTPVSTDPSVLANIALFGCLIEKKETTLGHRRRWDVLYDALSQVQESANLFSPKHLLEHTPQKLAFGEEIRNNVNPILTAMHEDELDFQIDHDIDTATDLLIREYHGNATRLASGIRRFFLGPIQTFFYAASRFMGRDDDSMRPQFVKLCLRWKAIEGAEPRIFVQPFSSGIAWSCLEAGALKTLSDQKTVVFQGPFVRPFARITAKTVIDKVYRLIENGRSSKVIDLRESFSNVPERTREWMIRQEIDTTMWRLSYESRAGKTDNWKWTLDKDVAARRQ
jgi:hypothetical protein